MATRTTHPDLRSPLATASGGEIYLDLSTSIPPSTYPGLRPPSPQPGRAGPHPYDFVTRSAIIHSWLFFAKRNVCGAARSPTRPAATLPTFGMGRSEARESRPLLS